MSTVDILAQLARLNAGEREQVRSKLDEIDAAPLSAEEKKLIDARVEAYRQRPQDAVVWAAAESKIRGDLGS